MVRCSRALAVVAMLAAGCSSHFGATPPAASSPLSGGAVAAPTAKYVPPPYIRHIVIMVQENRSFDNLFATYPGADGATSGMTHHGEVSLKAVSLVDKVDIVHKWQTFQTEYDGGKMDGFDSIQFGEGGPAKLFPYQYVKPSEIEPYWAMAQQYVLADHFFETQSSGSFIGHQDIIAGGTAISPGRSLVNDPTTLPWGCDAPAGTRTSLLTSGGQLLPGNGPFPCLKYATLRDSLDAKHVPWKYYAPPFTAKSGGFLWTAFDAIREVRYGPEWKTNISSPETSIFADIAQHKLRAVSWLIPDKENSDHPGTGSKNGPSWVAQVVNAIGESRAWDSTAIVVLWDDWGGFYDHESPPQLDYQGLGFRVPMLIISPYVRRGHVAHTQYEFGSILRFVEDNWHLQRLGTTDMRAASIGNVFDFGKPPREFTPIDAERSRSYFLHRRPSNLPVDTE